MCHVALAQESGAQASNVNILTQRTMNLTLSFVHSSMVPVFCLEKSKFVVERLANE